MDARSRSWIVTPGALPPEESQNRGRNMFRLRLCSAEEGAFVPFLPFFFSFFFFFFLPPSFPLLFCCYVTWVDPLGLRIQEYE